ncbi:MAG: ISAs1 family transposase, partial [Sphingomonadales bacterium]|nr:ISAs1 family transposase [Sphingomonadales bacterium]
QWVGLLGFCSASYHLRARDEWIGWDRGQRQQRRLLVAQNSRFLILPGPKIANLASRLLGLCAKRVAADYLPAPRPQGSVVGKFLLIRSVMRALAIGPPDGSGSANPVGLREQGRDYYTEHCAPKELWVKPLDRKATQWLKAAQMPAPWSDWIGAAPCRNELTGQQLVSLVDLFWQMPDARSRIGRRHWIGSVLAVAAVAVLAGARTYKDMADVAAHLLPGQLRVLRTWRDPKTKRHMPPSESTLWRVLSQVDIERFEQMIGSYIERLDAIGQGDAIAIDGKTLRGAKQPDGSQLHWVSAITHQSKTVRAQRSVDNPGAGSEIGAVAPLMASLNLDGVTVTLDALHTYHRPLGIWFKIKGPIMS